MAIEGEKVRRLGAMREEQAAVRSEMALGVGGQQFETLETGVASDKVGRLETPGREDVAIRSGTTTKGGGQRFETLREAGVAAIAGENAGRLGTPGMTLGCVWSAVLNVENRRGDGYRMGRRLRVWKQ